MNKTLIAWMAVIVLIVLGVVIIKTSRTSPTNSVDTGGGQATYPAGDTSNPNPGPADTTVSTPSTPTSSNSGGTQTSNVKSFTVTGKPFSFTPSTLTVNKGDTVKITFVNENGTHDWVLDEFNAKTSILAGGQSQTIEFVAAKAGTFEYYCSVGTHRQMGMRGTLIVK